MRTPAEVALAVIEALEAHGIPYALGGAQALSYWGTVRNTVDADVLASIPAIRYQELADALNEQDFVMEREGQEVPVDVPTMRAEERSRHLFRVFLEGIKAEIFIPAFSLQHEILRRAIRCPLHGREVLVTTAEDLILLKMIFHRRKDLDDVRGILWHQQGNLDFVYLAGWAIRVLEPAVAKELEQLVAEYTSPNASPGEG